MIATVKHYFSVIHSPPAGMQDRLKGLACALDDLVLAYNKTHDIQVDNHDQNSSKQDYKAVYATIAAAFPTLGYYADIEPTEDFDQTPVVGDAIDDLADIYCDLANVVWYADNVSLNTAIWHFRFLYQNHWGQHLHSVRRYLATSDLAAW